MKKDKQQRCFTSSIDLIVNTVKIANRRILDMHLHLESETHLIVKGGQVDFEHALNEGALVDVVIARFLEQTEKPIVDDSRQLSVLKEGHFVDKFAFFLTLLWGVAAHGHILEDGLEVGLGDVVDEFRIICLVEVLNEHDFLLGLLHLLDLVYLWRGHRRITAR